MSSRIRTAVALSPTTHDGMHVTLKSYVRDTVEPETLLVLLGHVEVVFANGDLMAIRLAHVADLDRVPALVGCTVQAQVYWQMCGQETLWPWSEVIVKFREDLFCEKAP